MMAKLPEKEEFFSTESRKKTDGSQGVSYAAGYVDGWGLKPEAIFSINL